MNILEVNNLSNYYEGEQLLRKVSFSLLPGEILCLLGPSGSGKTTLLRLLAGLTEESSGTISFQGESLHGIAPYRRNIGMMFQEYALFPHKNVSANVAFGLEMQKCNKKQRAQRIKEVLELVGLTGFERRQVCELSGGERQRVALARSLAPNPKLLLLDEPLGSLDKELRERLSLEIRTILKKTGMTAIFVTHDQTEAFTVADRIGIMQHGIMLQIAKPEELYRHPASEAVARFLGLGNILSGKIDAKGIFEHEIFCGICEDNAPHQPGKTLLLLRPEGASLIATDAEQCNILCGKVMIRQFLGSRYRLTIMAGHHSLVFELPLEPAPPQVGKMITLHIEQSSMVFLKSQHKEKM